MENKSKENTSENVVRSERAFAPAHITGFFQIFPNGSTGAGLNLADGVITTVHLLDRSSCNDSVSGHSVSINGEPSEAPVSRRVLSQFVDQDFTQAILVEHQISFPIGYGMGMSGAGSFSLALALNQVLSRGLSSKECMEIAKSAEISCGTGLGDVVAQQFKGLMIGLPPYPSEQIEEIPCNARGVVCGFFDALDTGTIIRDSEWKERINQIGEHCMRALSADLSFENFVNLSRLFSLETGLASREVTRVLEEVPSSSMAMLGQTVFAVTDDVDSMRDTFLRYTDRVAVSTLSESGAKVV